MKFETDEEFFAFMGGLYTGEGCLVPLISQRHGKWYISPHIVILTSLDTGLVIEVGELLELYGYETHVTTTRKKSTGVIAGFNVWLFRKGKVDEFAKRIFKYCSGKPRKQLQLYLEEFNPVFGETSAHRWSKGMFLELMKVVDKINALKKGKRGKYNYEYFKRLFEKE